MADALRRAGLLDAPDAQANPKPAPAKPHRRDDRP